MWGFTEHECLPLRFAMERLHRPISARLLMNWEIRPRTRKKDVRDEAMTSAIACREVTL